MQKYYENKQYKKGIKEADSILKKRPKDGETLCMKGLLVYHVDSKHRKQEALELCRRGLSHNRKSHVCWHVLGLLHRFEKEYTEAVQCYEEAIERERDNAQILRDLCNMQVKIRNYPGLVHYRAYFLQRHKPTRLNFVGLAVAHHLNGDGDSALQVLKQYESTVEPGSMQEERFVFSELTLYKASVCYELGQLDDAQHELDTNYQRVIDERSLLEMYCNIALQKGELERAQESAIRLVKINPEDHKYHSLFLRSLNFADFEKLEDDDIHRLLKIYKGLQARFFKSHLPRRMPLSFLRGKQFEQELRRYIKHPLRKGVPSLSSDLRPLYSDSSKATTIDAVIKEVVSSLKENLCFPNGTPKSESPATLLWALLLQGENELNFERPEQAIQIVDECIEHTPTALDAYTTKARALEQIGAHAQAAEVSEQARQMDLADRNINGFSTAKLFRAGRIEEASTVAQLFSRQEGSWGSIHDMQCLWFELGAANAYRRAGDRANALWQLDKVIKHFDDFEDDEFDFHQYCLRRMTLRRYIDMVRYVDCLRSHPYFVEAAENAVEIRLSLFDLPYSEAVKKQEEAELAHLSASQRKKQLKARKQKQLQQGETEAESLAKADDQLKQASLLVEHLQAQVPERQRTHALAFGVYVRRQKMLLALRSLRRLSSRTALGMLDAQTVPCAVAFLKEVRELSNQHQALAASNIGKQVLQEEMDSILAGYTAESLLEEFEHRVSSLQDELALARCRRILRTEDSEAIANKLISGGKEHLSTSTLDDTVEVYYALRREFESDALAVQWVRKAQDFFPRSSDLQQAAQQQRQEQSNANCTADGKQQS